MSTPRTHANTTHAPHSTHHAATQARTHHTAVQHPPRTHAPHSTHHARTQANSRTRHTRTRRRPLVPIRRPPPPPGSSLTSLQQVAAPALLAFSLLSALPPADLARRPPLTPPPPPLTPPPRRRLQYAKDGRSPPRTAASTPNVAKDGRSLPMPSSHAGTHRVPGTRRVAGLVETWTRRRVRGRVAGAGRRGGCGYGGGKPGPEPGGCHPDF